MGFVGAGILHEQSYGRSQFALNYGLVCSFAVTNHLKVNLEAANAMTFGDFDSRGSNSFGKDNLLTLSAGISVNFGAKPRAVFEDIDEPYLVFNRPEAPIQSSDSISTENQELRTMLYEANEQILDLEDQLAHIPATDSFLEGLTEEHKALLTSIRNGESAVGAPVMFFFATNTARLREKAQLENIKQIADMAIANNLKVKVTGQADSSTGTAARNKLLGELRSDYIAKQLVKFGVPEEMIEKVNLGGVNTFSTARANRNSYVELFIPTSAK